MANPIPLISVLLPAYNCASTLKRSIDSIRAQTLMDWELIVVDDGSKDNTWQVLVDLASVDARIRPLRNERNMGISVSLNRAFYRATGKYIARMDGDDSSLPERFRLQVEYLDTHPDVDVLGTAVRVINLETGMANLVYPAQTHEELLRDVYKKVPFFHPSVMFRRDFFESVGGYDPGCLRCEDFDFWIRGSLRFRYANLPEVLLEYTNPPKLPTLRHLVAQTRISLANGIRQSRIAASIFAEARRWVSWVAIHTWRNV